MKVEKLYTLSQFVDKYAECWTLVRRYNEFLKQPLKKEMFVNEIERTTWEDVDRLPLAPEAKELAYCELLEIWRKAGEKVIFDDNKVYLDEDYPNCICIKKTGLMTLQREVSYLAEATRGNLKLKNIVL